MPREILIQGAAIQTRPENDLVAVDGPGTLSLWVTRGFLTSKIDDPVKMPLSEPTLLTISWTENMKFIGRTTDALGRPSGRIEFHGQVTAATADALIHCDRQMIVYTSEPVPLERVKIESNGPAKDILTRRPHTTLMAIRASGNAVAINRSVDSEKNLVAQQHRIEADETLHYDRITGNYEVSGKGRVFLFERASDVPLPAKNPAPALNRIDISFSKGMVARLGTGPQADTVARRAEFSGDVTVAQVGVPTIATTVDLDRVEREGCFLTANNLCLVSEASRPHAQFSHPNTLCLKASGNVMCSSAGAFIQSDQAFLLLPSELIYARSDHNRTIYSEQRDPFTKPSSGGTAGVIQFDLKSRTVHFVDRKATRFLDEKTAASRVNASPASSDLKPSRPAAPCNEPRPALIDSSFSS